MVMVVMVNLTSSGRNLSRELGENTEGKTEGSWVSRPLCGVNGSERDSE